jgi:beta-carotene ketolase (CrtW type)
MKIEATHSIKGVLIAVLIIVSWAASLVFLLRSNPAHLHIAGILPAMLLQTFLYTGLFITAHDAMHGIVAPQHKKLNNFIGALCVFLYALFSFQRLRNEHRKHHAQPASDSDPDYHDGAHRGFWAWYFHFMLTYVTWRQIAGMAIVFNVLLHTFKIPVANLLLFWIAPALLSTLQLFYFGTYLPHREPAGGYTNAHRARSNDFSALWSFLTCYHFGYHWEHHEHPYVPWWKLPAVRREILNTAKY